MDRLQKNIDDKKLDEIFEMDSKNKGLPTVEIEDIQSEEYEQDEGQEEIAGIVPEELIQQSESSENNTHLLTNQEIDNLTAGIDFSNIPTANTLSRLTTPVIESRSSSNVEEQQNKKQGDDYEKKQENKRVTSLDKLLSLTIDVPENVSLGPFDSKSVTKKDNFTFKTKTKSADHLHLVDQANKVIKPKAKPKKKNHAQIYNNIGNNNKFNNENLQQVDEHGVPLDMVRGKKFLQERLEEMKEINLSRRLLQKKQEEDDGIQPESDSGGEDFEDLLEIFDIDPEEISLDLSLNDRRKLLIDSMDDQQMNRYEFFRRTNLNIGGVRKLINSAVGVGVPTEYAKMMAGIGKVFVGEIVEKAKEVQLMENEAKVAEQLEYKNKLKYYEEQIKLGNKMEKPLAPTFYELLLQAESGGSLINIRRREDTYNSFRVIIPRESAQITPDQIREAWRLYEAENNNVIHGRWRQQGGGNGMLFR